MVLIQFGVILINIIRKPEKFEFNYLQSSILIIIAGLVWSLGPLAVKNMIEPEQYRWQYLFYRGMGLFVFYWSYQLISRKPIKNTLKQIDLNLIIAGVVLAIAMLSFIYSITQTTVAVTMLMLALMPLFGSIAGLILNREIISLTTFVAILISIVGCVIIGSKQWEFSIIGMIWGLMSSVFFGLYVALIRRKPNTSPYPAIMIAGMFSMLISSIIIFSLNSNLINIPPINILLSFLHGLIVSIGLLLFSTGTKKLLSGDAALLSLTEVVGGIAFSWIPLFGIYEPPQIEDAIGGIVIISAIVLYSINLRKKNNMQVIT